MDRFGREFRCVIELRVGWVRVVMCFCEEITKNDQQVMKRECEDCVQTVCSCGGQMERVFAAVLDGVLRQCLIDGNVENVFRCMHSVIRFEI